MAYFCLIIPLCNTALEITLGLLIQFHSKYQVTSLKVLKMTKLLILRYYLQSGFKKIIYLLELTFELEEVAFII